MNVWSVDRSWFLWTDWALWATKVSGSRELVDAIRANSALETAEWSEPGAPE